MNSFWPSYSSVDGTTLRTSRNARLLLGVDLGLVVAGDLPGRVEQERPEDVEDPVEALDEGHPGEDEDGPQHQGAEDAPEQDAELVLAGHGEEGEDHRPDEDVVDRQALLDQVAREVLARGLAPCQPRQ